MRLLFSFLLCILLCGCGTEPEDRSFVSAMWIDGKEGDFEVSLLTARGESNEESSEEDVDVIAGRGRSLYDAINDCSGKSSGELFFGHTMVCMLSPELTENREALRAVSRLVEEDAQLSRRIMLAVSEDGEKVLKNTEEGFDIARWLSEYYQTHKDKKPVEADKLCRAMAERGNLMLPVVREKDKGFGIEGGVLIAEGVRVQDLSRGEYDRISLLAHDDTKPVMTVYNDKVEVKNKKVKVQPHKVIIDIETKAKSGEMSSKTEKECAAQIRSEAENAIEILQKCNCDLIDMYRAFEIKGLPEESFEDMKIQVEAG